MRIPFAGMRCSAVVLMGLTACDLGPSDTFVVLVNDTTSQVDVELVFGEDQNWLEATLDLLGEDRNFQLAAGDRSQFSEACDDLQAIYIRKAEISIIGGIGPEEDTQVYRDGSDFGCGDTLTFTITQPEIDDLRINFASN